MGGVRGGIAPRIMCYAILGFSVVEIQVLNSKLCCVYVQKRVYADFLKS